MVRVAPALCSNTTGHDGRDGKKTRTLSTLMFRATGKALNMRVPTTGGPLPLISSTQMPTVIRMSQQVFVNVIYMFLLKRKMTTQWAMQMLMHTC